jgi:hypothetical protein
MHPYTKYEKTGQWKILKKAIISLQNNHDIEITTSPELVIGYLCKALSESRRIKKKRKSYS